MKRKDIHVHAISVHFTNALYPVSAFFLFLFLIFEKESFRDTYVYLMALATLSVPVSYLTGILEWRLRFKGAWIRIFISKLKGGALLFTVGCVCTLWHLLHPEVLDGNGLSRMLFIALNASTVPLVVFLGHLGGKLVFIGPH